MTGEAVGARFGRYEVLRRLGRGGAAEVFEARHVELHKRVALKVTHPILVEDERSIERVLREGRAATAIHHPHVVDVVDVGIEHRRPYLVMELLEGEDVASHLARRGPLSVEETADLLLPVVSGVCAVHRAGIVHRDLKPSNILLARRHSGVEPVVVDFGISKWAEPRSEPATSSQRAAGTVPYMCPEQIRGSAEVTPTCDQYALGVILYECVTGGTPFWSDDRYELLHAIMTGPVVPPSQVNPLIPEAFDEVILRALARDPGARFASVHALGEALWPFTGAEQHAKWSIEFGPAKAPEPGEPGETTSSPMAYARTALEAAGPRARLRALGAIAGAIVGGGAVWILTAAPRVATPPVSSRGPAVTSAAAPQRAVLEDRTSAALESEPAATRERGAAVIGADPAARSLAGMPRASAARSSRATLEPPAAQARRRMASPRRTWTRSRRRRRRSTLSTSAERRPLGRRPPVCTWTYREPSPARLPDSP